MVVALGWAGALNYFNGRFQTELRTGLAALSPSDASSSQVDTFGTHQITGNSRADLVTQSGNSGSETPESDAASPAQVSVVHQPPEVLCHQLLASIAAETDPDAKSSAVEWAGRSIPSVEMPEMLSLLKNNSTSDAADLRKALVARWAEENAPAAAAWAVQLPESPGSREALVQIAVGWANTDLLAATAWANALPEGAGKQAVLLNVANEAARTDPLAALGLVVTLSPSAERDDSLVHGISQWAGTDPSVAIAWAGKVPDPNLRQRLLGAAAIAAASQDGAVAANLVTSGVLQGAERDRAMVAVVQRWAQRSPAAAAAWLTPFPDSPARDTAVQHLVSVWAMQSIDAAQAWVRQLPEGSFRNAASTAYAQFASRSGAGLASLAPTP